MVIHLIYVNALADENGFLIVQEEIIDVLAKDIPALEFTNTDYSFFIITESVLATGIILPA